MNYFLLLILFFCQLGFSIPKKLTPLDSYFSYSTGIPSWKILSTNTVQGITKIDIELFSLYWPDEETPWFHRLSVYIPVMATTEFGIFYIDGGTNRSTTGDFQQADDGFLKDADLMRQAKVLNTAIVILKDNPNQYLVIDKNEPVKEDGIMAVGWKRLMQGYPEYWSPHFPMAKAGKIALDTALNVISIQGMIVPEKWIASGLSKRGWAVWLLALKDERIAAIMPTVIDILDLKNNLPHVKKSLGDWPIAFTPYKKQGVTQSVGTPSFDAVIEHEDPWSYFSKGFYSDRFSLPKFFVRSSGDDFFVPDMNNKEPELLPGKNHIRVLPNTPHHIKQRDYIKAMDDFYLALTGMYEFPEVNWQVSGQQLKQSSSDQIPDKVILWHAVNSERDFRFNSGIRYYPEFLEPTCLSNKVGMECVVSLKDMPEDGHYHAHFIEWHFPYNILTTPVYIFPDQYNID